MVRAAALSVVVWSFAAIGCPGASSVGTVSYPTTLTVEPASFRGALPCGGAGLHRYIVTLTDVTPGDATLAPTLSSQPAACTVPTSFSLDRAAGHAFTAEIDGYDRDDIVAAAPGERRMVDRATGAPVCPVWRAACGGAEHTDGGNPLRKPTVVVDLSETVMTGCSVLTRVPPGACANDQDAATGASDAASDAPESVGDVLLPRDAGVADVSREASQVEADTIDGPDTGTIPAADALATEHEASADGLDAAAQVLGDGTREGG